MKTGLLFLHTRRVPSGRWVATAVPFTDLTRDSDTRREAGSLAVAAARERLNTLGGAFRADLSNEAEAELESIAVTIGPERSGEKIDLLLSVVVVRYARSAGELFCAYAPGVGNWSAAAKRRDGVVALAKRALEDILGSWPAGAAMALDVHDVVSIRPVRVPLPSTSRPVSGAAGAAANESQVESSADDLTALAREGKLGRLDRRDPLVERVLAVLAADGRASVLLVGASDVGKTTLIHEVAARLAAGEVPPALRGRTLIRISANELIAGARFTGMWQERARQLIEHARSTGAIVSMGDPAGIVDAGRWSGSDNNLARVLRPYVERGELRLICEADDATLAAARKLEPSFVEVFYRIEVPEPDAEAAREILRAAARRIESNQDVAFDEDAIQAALDLTRRYEPYRALPGKAVRLLEETAQLIAPEASASSEASESSAATGRLGREEVTRGFARRTGMPLAILSDQVPLQTGAVRAFFEERVLGQAEAVEAMVDLIAVIKSALNDPGKPLATLFFVGPTGVGKTELTKALAEFLFGSRDRVLRFDMGEYASGDAAPRLTGSAWDRHDEGELTRRVREQPFCVVLLDEVEKAHRAVFDVLLPALGEGRLTDSSGRTADLRNAIVIMTSNLGASGAGAAGVGFARADDEARKVSSRRHFASAAEDFFRPEFFNRIDRVLAFEALGLQTISKIARREIGRLLLREGITRRRLLVEIDDAVVDRLAEAGFHPRYGARPLHREIERAVIRPLARVIVEQLPGPGELIRIGLDRDGEVAVSVHRVRESAPAREPRPPGRVGLASEGTLARVAARAREVYDEVVAEGSSEASVAIDRQLSELLQRVNGPGFWDDADAARATMDRTYQLQRVTDGLGHLRNRAEGLVELAEQLRRRRDRGRLGELRTALAEVEDALAIGRLEAMGAAAGAGEPQAVITCAPVGGEARGWAGQLLEMYAAWAERTGREVARVPGETLRLTIAGPGSYALLVSEAGLHRHDLPKKRQEFARVVVGRDGRASDDAGSATGLVVRVYSEGARNGVRDPRTRVAVGNLQAVLEQGRIDEFILAAAARRRNER